MTEAQGRSQEPWDSDLQAPQILLTVRRYWMLRCLRQMDKNLGCEESAFHWSLLPVAGL